MSRIGEMSLKGEEKQVALAVFEVEIQYTLSRAVNL